MSIERQKRVEAIFTEATAASRADRASILKARCNGDTDLQEEIESLLAAHDGAEGILDEPQPLTVGLVHQLSGLLRPDDAALPSSGRIGAYTVKRVLGSGGMGVVYLAEQERPKRVVALKVIRRGLASAGLLRRFEHEAEILGRLHHPGIAQIYEAGISSSESGPQPYIAMEYIDGRTLTEFANTTHLGTRERLALLAKVCDAVHHAHQRGVIHRDLKPANILIVPSDPSHAPAAAAHDTEAILFATVGQPKVLDFGVARLTDPHERGATTQTSVGQLIGTLPYMSPEQLGVDPSTETDIRSDVYALGVILYQLLAGKLPFDVASRALPEAVRMIKDDLPTRLSSFHREFRGELETITSKAIEKDKARRYQSAADLGADLRRFLRGEPIAAKRDSALYVFKAQLRRYRWVVGVAAAFILLLSAFAIYASATASSERLAKEAALRDKDMLDRTLYSSRIGFAQASYASNDIERLKRELAACPANLRGWEWDYLRRIADSSTGYIRAGEAGAIWMFPAPKADGLFTFQLDGILRSFRLSTGEEAPPWKLDTAAGWVCATPDGKSLLWGMSERANCSAISTRAQRWSIPPPDGSFRWVTTSPDSSFFIFGGPRHIDLINVDNGESRGSFQQLGSAVTATVNADGSLLATGNSDGTIDVRKLPSGERVKRLIGHSSLVRQVAFSRDSTQLASASNDKSVRVWSLATDRPARILWPHTNKVWSVAFTPDGKRIASGGTDVAIRITDIETGEVLRVLKGHSETVNYLSFSEDGSRLYSGSIDRTFRWWDAWDTPETKTFAVPGGSYGLARTTDGARLAVSMHTSNAAVLDAETGAVIAELKGPSVSNRGVTIAPDDSLIACAFNDGSVRAWSMATYAPVLTIPAHQGSAIRPTFSPDSQQLLTVGMDGFARIWNRQTGSLVREIHASADGLIGAAWSPNGKLLCAGGFDRVVHIWSAATGERIASLAGHTDAITYVGFAADSSKVISTSEDGSVRVWSLDGSEPRMFIGHKGPVYFATLSADESRLVTGGRDNTVRFWDFNTGEELLTLRQHIAGVFAAIFSTDGRRIYTTSDDGSIAIWDATPRPSPTPANTSPLR